MKSLKKEGLKIEEDRREDLLKAGYYASSLIPVTESQVLFVKDGKEVGYAFYRTYQDCLAVARYVRAQKDLELKQAAEKK
jgi:hypothetical protein